MLLFLLVFFSFRLLSSLKQTDCFSWTTFFRNCVCCLRLFFMNWLHDYGGTRGARCQFLTNNFLFGGLQLTKGLEPLV